MNGDRRRTTRPTRRWRVRRLRRPAATVAALTMILLGIPAPASADLARDRQWHLRYLAIDRAHAVSQGRGVTVAVIDTGVDADHPDLLGNIARGIEYTTVGGVPEQGGNGWSDTDSHGTAMAALIAAHGHGPGNRDGILGIAPRATILPVKGRNHLSSYTIRWAVDHGARAINVSLAGADSPDVLRGVRYALDQDVVVIAGAGNTAQGMRKVQAPARYPGVIAVSGIDQQGRFTPASAQGPEVVLAAPAVNIVTALSGQPARHRIATGTSNATAIVSGVVALVRAKYPELDAANVINRLIATADDAGPKGRDPQYGYGIVNPYRALTADVPLVSRNPLLGPPTTPRPDSSESAPAAGTDNRTGSGLLAILVTVPAVLLAIGALTAFAVLRRRRGAR